LNAYARRENLEIVKEFQEAASAHKVGRSKFNEMVEFIRNQPVMNVIKHLLVEKSVKWRTPKKGNWAFKGLVTCGHCGCSVVGEQKTNKKYGTKYTYYHCTGNRGKCPEKYVSETRLDIEFAKALSLIQLDAESVEYVKTALLNSHKDTEQIKRPL
jgi:Recombinase zinc beta ribbon domain